jgi:diguanylate cyclase (GGDEF)-like protein
VIGGATIVMFGLVVVRMIGLARAQEAAAGRESALRESVLRTESEVRLGALVQHSSDVILVLTSDMAVEYASPSVRQVLGYDVADFVGRRFLDAVPEEDRALVESALGGLLARASAPRRRSSFASAIAMVACCTPSVCSPTCWSTPRLAGSWSTCAMSPSASSSKSRLTYQAFHDPVTDLANRALFRDRVEHALSRRGDASRSLAVLFLDLDDFKIVNDTFGHDAGDRVLQTISTRLRSALRESDTVARLGGDEFAVLLEDVAHETAISEIVARAARDHQRSPVVDGREVRRVQHRDRRRTLDRTTSGHPPRSTSCCATPMSRCTRRRPPTATRSATSSRRCTRPWSSSSRCARTSRRRSRPTS